MNAMMKKGGIYDEKKMRYVYDKLPDFNPENIQVFLDIQIGEPGHDLYRKGRIVIELFAKNKNDHNNHRDLPITCENFRALCTGELGEDLHYKGAHFYAIYIAQECYCGDILVNTGDGGKSIYGGDFADEQVWYPHSHQGLLSMDNKGPDTNNSRFMIKFNPDHELDQHNTVFGRVIHNYNMMSKIESSQCTARNPIPPRVIVVDCGELLGDQKLTEKDGLK